MLFKNPEIPHDLTLNLDKSVAQQKARQVYALEAIIASFMETVPKREKIAPGVHLIENKVIGKERWGITLHGIRKIPTLENALEVILTKPFLSSINPELTRVSFRHVLQNQVDSIALKLNIKTSDVLFVNGLCTEDGMKEAYRIWLEEKGLFVDHHPLSFREPETTYLFDKNGRFAKFIDLPYANQSRIRIKEYSDPLYNIYAVLSPLTESDLNLVNSILLNIKDELATTLNSFF